MKISKKLSLLLVYILSFYVVLSFAFNEQAIYWYLYPFIILVGTAISMIYSEQKDEMSVWACLLYGIGYGVVLYGLVRLVYIALNFAFSASATSLSKFIATFGPNNIFHFVILIFIIVIGEELVWRGFVQHTLKSWMKPIIAVILTSLLYGGIYMINGFVLFGFLTVIVGLGLGSIYEWKKSMPLNIVTHSVFSLLLFLLIPFF